MNAIFKRKIWDEMIEWKNDLGNKYALLIEGARRVGKSTIVKRFVEKEFESNIIIDFSKNPTEMMELIRNNGANDLDEFFLEVQRLYKTDLIKNKSVIVFDEIQLCKEARQMIKHLVADGRYFYIETGSLISIRQNIEDILIPSEEHRIQMYPMDFEEFLWATGDNVTMDFVRKKFSEGIPMGNVAHNDTMRMFRKYMLVGGMPQAVSAFMDDNNFKSVEKQKRSILSLYYEDLGKLKTGSEKCKSIFSNIPGLLSRHDKTFKPGSIKKHTMYEYYSDAINSLGESKTVNICKRCSDPGPAPGLNADETSLKIYMGDTGLLFTASFEANVGDENEIYDLIINNQMNVNRGMFFENVVAQELTSAGQKLFFSKFRTKESVKCQEVDFVIARNGKIMPIDVKSANSARHTSLDRFRRKYKNRIEKTFVIHTKDLRVDDEGVTYLPAYMVGLIGKDCSQSKRVADFE